MRQLHGDRPVSKRDAGPYDSFVRSGVLLGRGIWTAGIFYKRIFGQNFSEYGGGYGLSVYVSKWKKSEERYGQAEDNDEGKTTIRLKRISARGRRISD